MAKRRKMVESGIVLSEDHRYAPAASLFAEAGYAANFKELELREVACGHGFDFDSNGFLQTFADVKGQRCRILMFAPHQQLQPHHHDLDESFVVTHGSVAVTLFKEDGGFATTTLSSGDVLEVPARVRHCLKVGFDGLVMHETVGEDTFRKRTTEFATGLAVPSSLRGKTVLVSGSSRGLGLGFVEQLLGAGAHVVATCRCPAKAEQLAALKERAGPQQLLILPLDTTDAASVDALPGELRKHGIESLSTLINNAGVTTANHPIDPILKSSAADMHAVFDTNVVGTVRLTQACLPLLRAAQCKTRTIANVSSQLASLEGCAGPHAVQGRAGGVACYRISKAAGNMVVRCFAGELAAEDFVCVAISPGHVATDMGSAGGRDAPLTVETSVRGMLAVIEKLEGKDNGRFLQHDGAELPW